MVADRVKKQIQITIQEIQVLMSVRGVSLKLSPA
jgi:hypothetical protein